MDLVESHSHDSNAEIWSFTRASLGPGLRCSWKRQRNLRPSDALLGLVTGHRIPELLFAASLEGTVLLNLMRHAPCEPQTLPCTRPQRVSIA